MIGSTLFQTLTFTGIFAITAIAVPNPDVHTGESLPRGYTEVPIEWEVQAFPDGDVLQLKGTAESVHSQLLELNPKYDTDFPVTEEDEEKEQKRSLEARDKCSHDWGLVRCDTKRNYARKSAIEDGIKYLRKIGGKPSLPAGPSKCGRVSCSYSAGIWWCNDYKTRHTLGSYDSIANGAQASP